MFEKKRQTGQNFEQGAQKPRGASDRRKNDRNPVNVAVYGNAHAMMPLIQGILHAENAAKHNVNRITVVISVGKHAFFKFFIHADTLSLVHFVFRIGELVGVGLGTKIAFNFFDLISKGSM